VVPDFVANAGGVICAAMEYAGTTQSVAFATVEEKIRANTGAVLAEANAKGLLPRAAAVALATRRVRQAMRDPGQGRRVLGRDSLKRRSAGIIASAVPETVEQRE